MLEQHAVVTHEVERIAARIADLGFQQDARDGGREIGRYDCAGVGVFGAIGGGSQCGQAVFQIDIVQVFGVGGDSRCIVGIARKTVVERLSPMTAVVGRPVPCKAQIAVRPGCVYVLNHI